MTRTEKLQKKFPAEVDAFITTDEKTRFYLTKFHSTDGTVFVTKTGAYLFADFRYVEAAEKEAEGCHVVMPEGKVSEEIKKIIKDEDIKKIGFEDELLNVASFERLKTQYEGVEFVPMSRIISEMSEFKDEDELSAIRAAQDITDRAYSETIKMITSEMTEKDVALELEYRMKKFGASGTSFDTICVSGTNSSRPHGVPSGEKLQRGFLTMDFGCVYRGYCSDMTRTVVIGIADDEMKRVYNTVLSAQRAAIEAVKVGMKCANLDKIARDIIYDAGYKGCFGHGLGHGVGIYIHENPRISPAGGETVVTTGHVFTIEPGIYIKGKYGVRIEDMMQITENGPANITRSPKELTELL